MAGQVGLITYMRTDSTRVSDEALTGSSGIHRKEVRERHIFPEKPNVYKSKKSAQEAHEAIRPTTWKFEPETVKQYLSKDEYNLYKLIFERFVASQMKPALFDVTDVEIRNGDVTLKASGEVMKFAGFLAVFASTPDTADETPEEDNSKALPRMTEGDVLTLLPPIDTKQNFTQPPPRFTKRLWSRRSRRTESAVRPHMVRFCRPSRAAITPIRTRANSFRPSSGIPVTRLLTQSFADIIDAGYTAKLEEELDEIEEGKMDWKKALSLILQGVQSRPRKARDEMQQVKGEGIKTEEVCEKCGAPMAIKFGRFGEFLACTNYPDCRFTKEIAKLSTQAAQPEEAIRAKVWQADDSEAFAFRTVLGLYGISRVPQHQRPAHSEGRYHRRAAATVREVRQRDGPQERPNTGRSTAARDIRTARTSGRSERTGASLRSRRE